MQPKALFLAEVIEADPLSKAHHDAGAAELRRLHELNQELTENLEKKSVAIQRIWKERDELRKMNGELLAIAHQYANDMRYPPTTDSRIRRLEAVLAVIKKAEGA